MDTLLLDRPIANFDDILIDSEQLETRTQELGKELLAELRTASAPAPSDWLYDRLMQLSTSDEATKVRLFRFVDVLPVLKTPHAIARHASELLAGPEVKLPPGVQRLLQLLTRTAVTEHLLSGAMYLGTSLMARRFIAGLDAQEAAAGVLRLHAQKLGFTLDLLGEAVTSESDARVYQQRYLKLIHDLPAVVNGPEPNLQLESAPWGPVPRANVSLKLSSLYSRFDPMATDATAEAVKERLRPILQAAREHGVFVNIDMEQYRYRSTTRRIFEEILTEPAFADWADVGIVVQAYLRDAEAELVSLAKWVLRRGAPIWVRLVKGAYWDYETIVAAQRNYPVPVFTRKADTDANYERLTRLLLSNWELLRPAIATHNVRSAAHARALAEELKLPPNTVEFQVLYGMGEPLGRALAAQGERVRVYVPFGELLPGMAYLVRRLLENSSNDSFIQQLQQGSRVDDDDFVTNLLAPPAVSAMQENLHSDTTASLQNGFRNEPETDFDQNPNQQQMRLALEEVAGKLGETIPIVIGGHRETSADLLERPDPSDTRCIASRSCHATAEQATLAVAAAHAAFSSWRDTPVKARSHMLRQVAAEFRRRRLEIAAWQVYEVGKPWRDADADVAEAIDFCEYYALEMERLDTPRRHDVPGEWNDYFYEPRGAAAVIAPWNFPLAILTGMTVAALVAGNTVVIKPSEQSARVGYFLMEALEATGIPAGVANFLPGDGEAIGPVLVSDPRIALVAFTGSREVGLSIIQSASIVAPGQREIKRVVAELGGKNAIIIDEDADLDEAVVGVVASAFGYSGQKCSACSRVVVIGTAYEEFCRRLAEAIRSIRIGPAEDPATTLGPVIDAAAQQRILQYIEIGNEEGELLARHDPDEPLETRGCYVPATAFINCPPEGRLCQEEIFGPVVAVLHAPDLDTALSLAQNSVYALTGGFYSRSPRNIERVRREFRVGNLYINRKITGALVDRQPFGGARLSGVGSKAGGPDYLLQFLVPRTVTESVMSRGFAPSEELREQTVPTTERGV